MSAQTDGDEIGPANRWRRRSVLIPVTAAAVLLVGYLVTAWAVSDRVPGGTTVAGVDIGGLDSNEASQTLDEGLEPLLGKAVPLAVAGAPDAAADLDPETAGLRVDVPGTVEPLVGLTINPVAVWRHLSGGGDVAPTVDIDQDALRQAVKQLAADSLDQEPVEGAVTFPGGVATPVAAVVGRIVDVDAATEAIEDHWPTGDRPIQLAAEEQRPVVDQDAVDTAMAEFATPATSAPLTVRVGERSVRIPAVAVGRSLSMTPDEDGALQPAVDGEALRKALVTADPSAVLPATDATVRLAGGRPQVVPAARGLDVTATAIAEVALPALTAEDRTAVIEPVVTEPELTTAEVEALGVREVISTFRTTLTPDAGRTENIAIAAAGVNGTLLEPGETFSMNDILGDRTKAKGYNAAPVIVDGRLVEGFGGGVSQLATTLFNAAFFAGLEDVEHQPHSFYISRYPEGREATVNYGTIDLRFRNDTDTGVLVQAGIEGGDVRVTLWGTKIWHVEATKSARRNVTQGETITESGPDCESQSAGTGFDVTVTRIFRRGGEQVRTEDFDTTYSAQDAVVCS